MAITIYENKAMSNEKMVEAGRRYWRTREGLLVLDGDPRAYALYAHAHHRVPEDEFKALLAESGLDKPAKKLVKRKKASSKKRATKS